MRTKIKMKMKKKGQMKLSFGMIFSIILIIVFIAFAFYAISKFMAFQKELKYRTFTEDFQSSVDKMYASSQGSKELTFGLPRGTDKICFVNDIDETLRFEGKDFRPGVMIDNLNIEEIVIAGERGKYCIGGMDGKFTFMIQKSYGESLVMVSRI